MKREYLQDPDSVAIPTNPLTVGGRCINQFCQNLFCVRHHSRPTVWEERWLIRRVLGYTLIFYAPQNIKRNWKHWRLLSAHINDDDARAYASTL